MAGAADAPRPPAIGGGAVGGGRRECSLPLFNCLSLSFLSLLDFSVSSLLRPSGVGWRRGGPHGDGEAARAATAAGRPARRRPRGGPHGDGGAAHAATAAGVGAARVPTAPGGGASRAPTAPAPNRRRAPDRGHARHRLSPLRRPLPASGLSLRRPFPASGLSLHRALQIRPMARRIWTAEAAMGKVAAARRQLHGRPAAERRTTSRGGDGRRGSLSDEELSPASHGATKREATARTVRPRRSSPRRWQLF
uniref:Uncharacterized protein n=1 Tax=Oryza meridionalis TaxID=40149 RepID=A0A0E0EL43_9ORYZ